MHEPLDTAVHIEAPEHIVFRHVVAGPGRRSVAHVIDLVVCYGAFTVITVLIVLAAAGFAGFPRAFGTVMGSSAGLILVVLFAAQWLYGFLWEGITSRSPGKMALDLRVVMVSGRPIGFGAAALRNVLRAADVMPAAYLVGLVAMVTNRRFQRLGDLVAGTMVVVAGRPSRAAPVVLSPPAAPGELAALPEAVALDVDERGAIELFLRRRSTLGRAREEELASLLMDSLQRRFGFRLPDASRTLALLYDRAANVGREEGPPSSRASGATEAAWSARRDARRS